MGSEGSWVIWSLVDQSTRCGSCHNCMCLDRLVDLQSDLALAHDGFVTAKLFHQHSTRPGTKALKALRTTSAGLCDKSCDSAYAAFTCDFGFAVFLDSWNFRDSPDFDMRLHFARIHGRTVGSEAVLETNPSSKNVQTCPKCCSR